MISVVGPAASLGGVCRCFALEMSSELPDFIAPGLRAPVAAPNGSDPVCALTVRARCAASVRASTICDEIDRTRCRLGVLRGELEDAVAICRVLESAHATSDERAALARAERHLSDLSS